MKKKFLVPILITAITGFTAACSNSRQSPDNNRIRFAITGNSYPESPFTGFNTKISRIVQQMNIDNPVMVFHTGNIVHGGHSWMGLKEKDITRQYRIVLSKTSKITGIFYPIPGKKDLFDKSLGLFTKFTEKQVCYSVNYGSIHFSLLSLIETEEKSIEEQLEWLKEDLRKHSKYQSIFIITHTPIYIKIRNKAIKRVKFDIHSILKKYPVKAVISGGSKNYSEVEIDTIRYIAAGTGGFYKEERYYRYNQYYIVDFDGISINVKHKKIK